MRQSITKIMKSMARIAVCSIGGVLTLFGIMLGIYALVQLPDGASKYMPYVVISILTLSAGLYLCFLVIKPTQYLIKSCKMTKEEKVIENIKKYMKKRKSRIAALTFIVILNIFVLILLHLNEKKLTRTITSEDIRLLSLVKLIVQEWYFALFTGVFIAGLVIEISGLNRDKHKLTLCMWERIVLLENEVKELKACTQVDDQQNK